MLGHADMFEHLLAQRLQGLAGRCDADPGGRPVEQAGRQLILQPLECRTDAGLLLAQRARRGADPAGADDFEKHLEQVPVDRAGEIAVDPSSVERRRVGLGNQGVGHGRQA